jgi:PAS domain S-box-containing protein
MENINVNPEFSPKSPDVERQLAELRLEERERFLRTLISNLPGIVYRCRTDEEWTSEFMSDGVEIVGYAATDFVESRRVSWDDVMHPEDRERVRAAVRDLMSESVPFSTVSHLFSYRLTSKSGDIKHVRDRFRFVFDRAGVIIALEGVITDVTELTLADERVGESENRYRMLAENISDLVCLHDLDGTFLYLSPSAERVLGFEPDELAGENPYDFFHPEDVAPFKEDAHQPLLGGASEAMSEYRMRRKAGEYVWLETMWQRVETTGGELVRLLSCSRDITKRKELERERNRAEEANAALLVSEQKARLEAEHERELADAARCEAERANRAKDEFLQMISHEFRTPLTTIKAAVRLIVRDGVTDAEKREYLETIGTECDRQIDMIINLLDISRLDAGAVDLKHQPLKIADVLRSCDRIECPAARAREQEFTVATGENLPPVRGDVKALRRAFCTIIENAVKYTPVGGRIEVSAEQTSAEEIVVRVADNGRGIAPEDLPNLFQKFFRGRNPAARDSEIDGTPDDAAGRAETPGVGLGLYLAKRLINALDGRIEVESEPKKGSRFSIFLPIWNADADEPDATDEYDFDERGEIIE